MITGRSEVGRTLEDLYPRYRVPLKIEELDIERLTNASGASAGIDAAVVAYPHAASAPVVAALRARGVRVCDLSADFRLRELATYEQWYGPHPHPELLAEAVYGLTELPPRGDPRRWAGRDAGLLSDRIDARARAARARRVDRRSRDRRQAGPLRRRARGHLADALLQ